MCPFAAAGSGLLRAGRNFCLAVVEGCPFYVGAAQYPYWANCQLTLDVTSEGGDSFSLEAADRVRFVLFGRGCLATPNATRSRPPVHRRSGQMQRRDTSRQGCKIEASHRLPAADPSLCTSRAMR